MKKIFILVIIMLSLILIMLSSLFLYDESEETIVTKDYTDIILSNSSWSDFSKSDFNSLLLKTYSDNVLSILSSLEDAIPVIVEVNNGKFSEENKNNFIVMSSFASSSNVYIYLCNGTSYEKKITSLESILENTVRFFMIDNKEVLK